MEQTNNSTKKDLVKNCKGIGQTDIRHPTDNTILERIALGADLYVFHVCIVLHWCYTITLVLHYYSFHCYSVAFPLLGKYISF